MLTGKAQMPFTATGTMLPGNANKDVPVDSPVGENNDAPPSDDNIGDKNCLLADITTLGEEAKAVVMGRREMVGWPRMATGDGGHAVAINCNSNNNKNVLIL